MKVLLDTCAWLRWLHDPHLRDQNALTFDAHDAIDAAMKVGRIFISDASVWEIAIKSAKGKLDLGMPVKDWVRATKSHAGIRFAHLRRRDLIASTALLTDWDHKDPFDRVIVALGRRLDVSLVTSDREIRRSGLINCIW